MDTSFISSGRYGTVKPLDQVRCINTIQAPNVRDIGGWACDGGTVKYGLLYRGGEPSAADRAVLVEELGVRHDLNLRGASEATWDVSPLGDDVYFTKADAYNWYTAKVNDAWRVNLRCVFDAVTHGEPVFFHCAAGADRTGTLACVLEGLLGVSQSDIDKDYELTCFYSGAGTDNQARRRNEAEWTGLINDINAYDGDTFRDKCATFAAQLGFTASEINAYRRAMIDGEPEEVTPSIATYDVSNTLTNVATTNDAATATEYQPYETEISTPFGYAIESVKVMMGGKDVTAQVFSGTTTNLRRAVKVTATNCTVNGKKAVIDGQDFVATVTAYFGCGIDDVMITMGGVDVSTFYSDGKIAIPNVTGDIEIVVTAVKSVSEYTNLADTSSSDWHNDSRENTAGEIIAADGYVVTNYIPCNKGDVIRVYGLDLFAKSSYLGNYNSSFANQTQGYTTFKSYESTGGNTHIKDVISQNTNGVYNYVIGTKGDGTITSANIAYVRITAPLTGEPEDVIITINEPIE